MIEAEPASAPIGEDSTGKTRRLHPLTLVLAVVRLGPRSLSLLPAMLALGFTDQAWLIVPALGLFLLASLAFSLIAWNRFSWAVQRDDVSISSGVISRKHRTVPFDRIQDVTIEQGMIARALGLAKVGFETGSAAGAKDETKIDSISLSDAEALRAHIRAHRAAVASLAGSVADETDPGRQELDADRLVFTMTPPRLLLAGLFNFSLAVFAVLFGLLQTFDHVLSIDPYNADFWIGVTRSTGVAEWLDAHRWMSALGGVILLLLIGVGTGIVRTVMRDYGFRLHRSERGFRRRRGLTTKTDVAIPVARVQAAIIKTGIIRRHFGWYELRLQSLASDGKHESDHLVAPLARLDEVDAILADIGLAREPVPGEDWRHGHPGAIAVAPAAIFLIGVIFLIPNLIEGYAFVPADWVELEATFILGALGALGAAALLAALIGWLEWKGRCWRFDGLQLHIKQGLFTPTFVILPARNIQSADLTVGPLLRCLSCADLRLGVPGGSGGRHHVQAVPIEKARLLRAKLLAMT